jgi:hypothetical protein
MINEARRDFGNPTVEFIQVQGHPTKVDLSKDATQAIYGADTIGVIDKTDGWIVDEGIVYDNTICTIKNLPNTDILVNNFANWDLILLDRNLNEKGKLKGGFAGEPSNYRNIQTRNAEDDKFILWLSHPDHLSIVRTNNLSSNEIRNFWKFNDNRVTPIACAISPSGKKLVGISRLGGVHILHYYEGSDQVVMYKQEDIHQKCTEWESLEISYDQDCFLLGGNDQRGSAYVLVLTLNEEANLITEKVLPSLRSVSCIKRHSEGDVYFAGGHRGVNILFYHKKQLHVLRDINVNLDAFIKDISFNHGTQELFAATGTDKIVVLNFSNESTRPARLAARPIPIVRQRRKLGETIQRSSSQPVSPRPIKVESARAEPIKAEPLSSSVIYPPQGLPRQEPRHLPDFNEFTIRQLSLPNSNQR